MRHFLLKLRYDFLWTLYNFLFNQVDKLSLIRSSVYLKALKAEDDYAESAMAKNSAYWNFVDNAEPVVTGHVTLPDGESIPIVKLINQINSLPCGGDTQTWAEQEQARYSELP